MFYQVMRTELIKLRRAPVWIAFFALTALSAVMGTFNYLNNTGILTQQCPYGIIKTNGKTQCFQGFQRLSLPIQFLFQP